MTAPLAVGGIAILLVASTAGATTAVNAAPGPAPVLQTNDPGTAPITAAVPAGTGGPIRVLLVGDSEASFLGFGLGPDARTYNVYYQGDGVFGCGLLTFDTLFHGTVVNGAVGQRGGHTLIPCATQLTRWRADVEQFHPDVVLLAEGEYEVRDQRIGGSWQHIGSPGVDARERSALERATSVLGSTGAVVVLLTAPYYHQLEQSNGQPWPEDDPSRVDRYNASLRALAASSHGRVVVADLGARLDPHGAFAASINGVQVRFADGIHVTADGAKMFAPWLLKDLGQLGVANRSSVQSGTTTIPTDQPTGAG